MPTVPVYDQAQEREAALPGFRQDSLASPAMLGAPGEAQQKIGEATLAAGTGLEAVAYKMQEKANLQKVQDAAATYTDSLQKWQEQAQKTRTNSAAAGLVGDFSTWHQKAVEDISKGLDNDAQRQAFNSTARKTGLAARHDVATFEIAQTKSADKMADDAMVKTNTDAGAKALTDDAANVFKSNIINSTRAYDAAAGVDPKVTEARVAIRVNEFHADRIHTMVANGQSDQAAVYYKENKKEITDPKVGEFVEKADAVSQGAAKAQEIWSTMGPTGDNDAANIDAMKSKVREDLKDKPFARQAALTELSQMFADRNEGIRARDSKRAADVNTLLLQGVPFAKVQKSAAWAQLDGTEQSKIIEHQENLAAAREGRAAARESRAYTAEARAQNQLNVKGLDTMIRLSDPDILVKMDRNDIINLRTSIGDQNTISLLNKWDGYTKNGTLLSEGKVDNDQFKVFAVKAGLDPDVPASKDKDMAERVQSARDTIERMIGAEQAAKKRPLTREEKDTLMQKQIDNKVIEHHMLMPEKSVPAIALPADAAQDAYVMVDGARVKPSSIPAEDRAAIIASRRKAGLPVTEQAIAEYWTRKKNAPSGKAALIPQ